MSESQPTCDICGELSPPNGGIPDSDINTICPPCEDGYYAEQSAMYGPIGRPTGPRAPPHSNTTR